MEKRKKLILDRASELTYSGIKLSGEAQFVKQGVDEFAVIIDKNFTEDSVLESLYILDCIGFDIDKISFSDKEFFIIKDDVDVELLEDYLYKYKTLYRIEKEQIYDYEDDEENYDDSYVAFEPNKRFLGNGPIKPYAYTTLNSSFVKPNAPNRNQRIYDKKQLNQVPIYENVKFGEEQENDYKANGIYVGSDDDNKTILKVQFDASKFKTMKSDEVVLNLMDFISDDTESENRMKKLGDDVEALFCEYLDVMHMDNIDISKCQDIHFKRMRLVEEERIRMKDYKLGIIYNKLETAAKVLCDDIKDDEQTYKQNIIATVLSFKRIIATAITSLLNDAFEPFTNKIREQHEVVLNIIKNRGE